MDRFIPRYFSLLGAYAQPLFDDSGQWLQELMAGTQAMMANTDPALTNREVFWQVFSERTGLDVADTEVFFNRFYEGAFGQLEAVTERRPVAARLVQRCLEQGIQVVIATNPLFPLAAIEQRLAWAGLPVSEYDFALVTDYGRMHAAKPHLAYYEEILERIGAAAENTLMVGDDWENDIEPSVALGMRAFWITPDGVEPPSYVSLAGYGTLDDFYEWWQEQ